MLDMLNAPVVLVFLGTSGFFFLVFVFLVGVPNLLARRRARMGGMALSALPRLGMPLMPSDELEQTRLQQRLIHAGLYGRSALPRFLGVRVVVLLVALLAAIAVVLSGLLELPAALLAGCVLLGLALVGPGLWLDWLRRERQRAFRHGLPDVLDILTICLEGGLSLPAALQRVTDELQTVYPLLDEELGIVQREMLLGLSAGEALRKFAARTGLAEARDLASVVLHAERYGVSIVNAMRIEADAMRLDRQQQAEEMAQKAAVKIIFPSLLLIFPAIFIIVLGPAVYGIMDAFANMK
jgi:tight adherence protein C